MRAASPPFRSFATPSPTMGEGTMNSPPPLWGRLAQRAWRGVLFGVALTLFISPAHAQNDPFNYTGADRSARILAGAKREGTVAVYSSITLETMTRIVTAFEKKYATKVDLWRGTAGDILRRVATEARGRRFAVDVVEGAAADTGSLAREDVLQEVSSPFHAELMPGAVVKGRPWVSSRLSIFIAAYNTNAVSRAELPKTYEDLLHPRWRGRIGIEAGDANWLMAMADTMGEPRALKLFGDIAAKNGFAPRVGHTLIANLIASGEVPFSLTIYSEAVDRLKRTGAPIEALYLAPLIGMDNGLGVMKRSPHPYAAMLFYDFMLSDGQKIMQDDFYPASNLKYQRLPAGAKPVMMDVPKYLDQNAKWTRLYKDILARRPR